MAHSDSDHFERIKAMSEPCAGGPGIDAIARGWSIQVIDERGDAGGAEAVVDVDDADVRRTGIEHSKEGSDSAE